MLNRIWTLRYSSRRSFLLLSMVMAGVAPHCSVGQSTLAMLESSVPTSASGSTASGLAIAVAPADRKAPALNPSGAPATIGMVASGTRNIVTTTVRVHAKSDAVDTTEGYERRISSEEVEQSAGTFGDPARFMQMLPGVVSDNDQRNDFIVRGGNPGETLFVVDNIQMPSISHLALSDTTGGFVSMIDNAAVRHMTLHTDAYDSKFDQRLSAVVEMSTRPEGPVDFHVGSEFGIGGTGVSIERPLGTDGAIFVSLRRSILNLFTKDVGMNGVPIYNNALVRANRRVDERNNWWGLSLTGVDSMTIHPEALDTWETTPFDIFYNGWRNTTGINWQHVYSARSFSVLSVSNTEQEQTIRDTAQMLGGVQTYFEDSHDGITTLKCDSTFEARHWMTLSSGGQTSVDRINYDVQQPIGLPNPYSADPTLQARMAIRRVFTTSSSAGYVQAVAMLGHGMKIVAGGRASHWAILGSLAATPKVVYSAPIPRTRMMIHIGYAEYAQIPPSLYLLSFSNQEALMPIRSRHLTAGVNVVDSRRLRMTLNAYQKRYRDYPVSVTFPELTMANIADTFGQAFLMFPMTSQGMGVARGVEAAVDWRPMSHLTVASTVTYMRSWYSGLDGVLRKGSFDMPLVGNVSGNALFGKGWRASIRYSASTGKPYTPDNLDASTEQNRDVYDLTRLNSLRAPAYSRLDFRGEWTHSVHRGFLAVHIGLQNALGSTNFYNLLWRPRCTGNSNCGTLQQNQMPRFPDFGVRWFH